MRHLVAGFLLLAACPSRSPSADTTEHALVAAGSPNAPKLKTPMAIPTPLSDLIDAHQAEPSIESTRTLFRAFLGAQLGVVTKHAAGSVNGKPQPVQVDITRLDDGNVLVLAYADPAAWTGKKLARVAGTTLLDIVDVIPNCKGVSVNSATKEIHFQVDRSTIQMVLDEQTARPSNSPAK